MSDLTPQQTGHACPVSDDAEMRAHLARPGASRDERIDALELALCDHPGAVELEVVHRFTPGMYSRELRAPAGVLATTYIHRQRHQFVLIQGRVEVSHGDEPAVMISAPYHGITEKGTRRIVFVHEPAVWTTFHPTDKTTVEEVEAELYEFRTLPDGSNVRDRFLASVERKRLEGAAS
jgi:hypothetical protein